MEHLHVSFLKSFGELTVSKFPHCLVCLKLNFSVNGNANLPLSNKCDARHEQINKIWPEIELKRPS